MLWFWGISKQHKGRTYQFPLDFNLIHSVTTMVVKLAMIPSRRRCSGRTKRALIFFKKIIFKKILFCKHR
jgi:hypothetical protein